MSRPLQILSRKFGQIALIVLVFFCSSSAVLAVSLSEYQNRLKGAISALDGLGQDDQTETSSAYERRLTQTTEVIRQTLPEKLTVDLDRSVYNVDNSWLYDGLREFEAASDDQRESLRHQLMGRLRSIDERVTELDKAKYGNADSKTDANRKLAEILTRDEYAKKNKQGQVIFKYIERLVNWLLQFLPQRPVREGQASRLTSVAQILVIALALAVLIFVSIRLVRHFRQRDRGAKIKKKKKEAKIVLGERLEPDASATDLLAEAESLARNGEIRAAIRKAYIALLVELGDRKVISLAQHKTNRDYLRSVRAHPSIYRNMSGLTDSFERHWYGLAQSSTKDWQDFRAGYLAALQTND